MADFMYSRPRPEKSGGIKFALIELLGVIAQHCRDSFKHFICTDKYGCVNGCVLGQTGKFAQSQNTACLGRYLATDDDGQERTVTDARGAVSALAELRQNKTTPLFFEGSVPHTGR